MPDTGSQPPAPAIDASLEAQLRAANAEVYNRSVELADKNKALAAITAKVSASAEVRPPATRTPNAGKKAGR